MSIALCLALLGMVALGRRRGPPLVLAAALCAVVYQVGPEARAWLGGSVQTWNLYHYTAGARFFGELGYDDLYLATLAVDREREDHFHDITVVRDLRTYQKVPRREVAASYEVDDHLSPDRQQELATLAGALEASDPGPHWGDMFRDRGYNATPAYTAVAAPIAEVLPAEVELTRRLSTVLDPVLLGAGLLALWAAFGLETTALVALALALFPGTDGRWLGGFLEYDWLAALMVGVAAVKADRPRTAGLAFAWATASRVFPAALVVSLLLPEVRAAWSTRRVSPFALAFSAAFGLGLAAFVLLGCATPRGPGAWPEFVARILVHGEQHVLGDQRIGWRHLLLAAATEDGRAAAAHALAPVAWGVVALGLAVHAWVASTRDRIEALQLGWLVVFLVTASSRYYWAGAALVATVPGRGRWLALGLGASRVVFEAARLAGLDRHGVYVAVEAWIGLVLVGWLAARPRSAPTA